MSTFIAISDEYSLTLDLDDTISIERSNALLEYLPAAGSPAHALWMAVINALTDAREAAARLQASHSCNDRYDNGHDDGYRAGMQRVRTQLAEGTLPPGFDWEVVINGTHAHQDVLDQAGYKRMVGPKIPIGPERASEEAIAELRRRLTTG